MKRLDETRKVSEWFVAYKSRLKCWECGESHPACLDFHHTDEKSKLAAISTLVAKGFPIWQIMAEIEKCEVLCSNCHRKLHYEKRLAKSVEAIGAMDPRSTTVLFSARQRMKAEQEAEEREMERLEKEAFISKLQEAFENGEGPEYTPGDMEDMWKNR